MHRENRLALLGVAAGSVERIAKIPFFASRGFMR